jgi:hypothetical protein
MYKDGEFLCFEKELVNSNSHPNKFYVVLDFLSVEEKDKIYYYKQLYLNILYNFNVPLDNILILTKTPMPKMLKLLYGLCLELNESDDKSSVIHQVNQFLSNNIGKTITENNLSDCSVIVDVTARGTIKLSQPNQLISIDGTSSDDSFLDCSEFSRMVDCLYSNPKIRDINYVMNSCYSGFKFGGLFFNWLVKKNKFRPNSNLLTSKPLLIYFYILILFLETNPKSVDGLTNISSLDYIENNLLNLGFGHYLEFINRFKAICQEFDSSFLGLIGLQQTTPFNDDRSDMSVFSNNLLQLFNEINNDTSYMLFHSHLEGPFKQLDSLKDLKLNFGEFNEMLSKSYLELVNAYLSSEKKGSIDEPAVARFGIDHFKFVQGEKDLGFILKLIKKSFEDVPFCFLTSLNRQGTRYEKTEPIVLEEIF